MRELKTLLPVAGALAIMAIAGCTQTAVRSTSSPEPAAPSAPVPRGVSRSINLSGFPPEYKRAFEEGCTAAKRGNPASRPRGDGPAVQGWNDGYAYCRPR
jgi:curli biogenesis system outer membrane secretion channel CsgG